MILMPKASITIVSKDKAYKCLFNPSEFQIERSANYVEHKVPGLDRPILQYISGEAETMTFSLFFDTFSSGALETGSFDLLLNNTKPTLLKKDVAKITQDFYSMLDVDQNKHTPSEVTFKWGTTSFTGYVIRINQKFTMFSSKGVPLRATLEITLKSTKKDNNIRNSPDRTKQRIVKSDDRLYSFAYAEYGDCADWRRIAEGNGIDNPRRLKSGKSIVIPAII
ncbi:MAG: hypothetical protein APF81_15385 [Desulfosporosinus sp. BRH_c37]|nr:MAG: hypothetical protein APF81_15385 [Desulfosporosinus sp. BRH_c37]